MFEKFKLSINKRLIDASEFSQLASDIESQSVDSKITIVDLKSVLEDRYGIVIRDALYDQLASYFDLDRNGTIFIASFCAYLYDTTLR